MSFQLYVGNYPCDFSRNDLVNLFKDFEGVTLRKWFKKDLKSYCFFTCDDIEQVVNVIQKMNNVVVSDRKLIVRAADDELHNYVQLILQEEKCDTETLKDEKSYLARKNAEEVSQTSSNSPPFVPMQVLRNKTPHKTSQSSCSDAGETNSLHSKSPSSQSSKSERRYNPSHHRLSCNSFLQQNDDDDNDDYGDDDDISECVWLSVTNFPFKTPVRFIYKLFDDYAPLKVIMVCNYPKRDKTVTEALVCFLNREVADDVILNFDNTMFNGRILLVNDVEDLTVMKELVNVVH